MNPTLNPNDTESDRCPRCGGAFHCGARDAQPCACFNLELTDTQRAALRAAYSDCLCLNCLQAIAAGAPVKPGPVIVHNAAAHRFETTVDGLLCVASYHRDGNTVDFNHTGVPHQLEGRGIAAALVREALAWARGEGLQVRASCSYVAVYLRRHPA